MATQGKKKTYSLSNGKKIPGRGFKKKPAGRAMPKRKRK